MALVQQNLVPATGDHLVTLDTETNLEWLSLNATANLSYLAVLGGAGFVWGAISGAVTSSSDQCAIRTGLASGKAASRPAKR